MLKTITSRFLECYQYLKDTNQIKSASQFSDAIDLAKQTFNAIEKGRREVRVEMVEAAVLKYSFNPVYLFTGEGDMFLVDHEDCHKANISIVPIKAQAGYCDHITDAIFQSNLPKFHLPLVPFEKGEFRCFEVEGESMYPTLQDGNFVICSLVDATYYYHRIKQDKLYVIITDHEILVKRLDGLIYPKKEITLNSDNSIYPSVNIPLSKVKEVWEVNSIVLTHIPAKPDTDGIIQGKIMEVLAQMTV